MASAPHTLLSPEEYLALDRAAERKSEYLEGEAFAMAGASPRHVLLVTNLVAELRGALRDRPCAVFSSDLRLQVTATGLYAYPDVMVACGELRFSDEQRDTLLNPTVVVEVLSPSTENWDRGGKFAHYRSIESLNDYLLVAQDRPHVELFSRQADSRWLFSETDDHTAFVDLRSVDVRLALAEIYAKLDLVPR